MAASPAVNNCVIWCWISSTAGGKAIPYPPVLSREIEENFHRSNPSYTATDGTCINYSKMQQLSGPRGRGGVPNIQRCLISLPSSPHLMAYWEWDSGPIEGYLPYIIPATVDIEIGHLNKSPIINLAKSPSRVPYTIDYTRMQQCRHGYNTLRNMRRVPLMQPLQELLREQSKPLIKPTLATISNPATSILSDSSSLSKKPSATKRKSTSSSRTSSRSPITLSSSPSPSSSGSSVPVTRSRTRAAGLGGKGPAAATGGSHTSTVKGSSNSRVKKKVDKQLETVLGELSKFVKRTTVLNFGEDGPCPICMNNLSEESGFEEETSLSTSTAGSCDVCKLKKCGHMMHTSCLIMYSKSSSEAKGCIRCPTCKVIHGIHTGDMPTTGSMTVNKKPYSLPGHEGCNTIEIVYNFTPGVQNGVPYRANGFPRYCYLPGSPKGEKILKLLRIAWERRLTFTIGTSVTTGATNTIVWNEIHHKTESCSNTTGHGYPDEHYLDNVLGELASQGITIEGEGEEREHSSDSDL